MWMCNGCGRSRIKILNSGGLRCEYCGQHTNPRYCSYGKQDLPSPGFKGLTAGSADWPRREISRADCGCIVNRVHTSECLDKQLAARRTSRLYAAVVGVLTALEEV